MDTTLDAWFVREILVHEAALEQYLRRCWSHSDELLDLRQEVYVRVYEAAGKLRPHQPKSFLFATARHLITDRLRRGRVVSIEPAGDFESLNVLVDEVSPERRFGARQILKRLAEAFDRLPDRCREVVWLRRVEELPQKEVARRLGITEKAVEKQIAKGMRLIADHFHGADEIGRRAPQAAQTAAERSE
ncbi:RNA polymerase sigma factor [Tahibacter aquaticus]|nr:sigma-70 family RNA polymerase sigma factor [Tahibacter aquaticus]